jgi:division protein CdvB (Snf7/Vps24/ESCRT-III family)
MPEASQELGNIGNLLGEIVTTTNQGTDIPMNSTAANEDALKILQEAEVAAAKHLEQKFPEVDALRPTKRMTGVEA